MEAREGISSGVTVIGAEAPSAYHVAPRSEAPNQVHVPDGGGGGGGGGGGIGGAPGIGISPVSVGLDGTAKKKRGRPRKYGPDGSVTMALSPMPISSSAPSSNDFSSGKRGKMRGMEYKQSKKLGLDYLGKSCILVSLMSSMLIVLVGNEYGFSNDFLFVVPCSEVSSVFVFLMMNYLFVVL